MTHQDPSSAYINSLRRILAKHLGSPETDSALTSKLFTLACHAHLAGTPAKNVRADFRRHAH